MAAHRMPRRDLKPGRHERCEAIRGRRRCDYVADLRYGPELEHYVCRRCACDLDERHQDVALPHAPLGATDQPWPTRAPMRTRWPRDARSRTRRRLGARVRAAGTKARQDATVREGRTQAPGGAQDLMSEKASQPDANGTRAARENERRKK